MDLITAIKSRRTHHEFKPDPVDRSIIEACLEAAIWAPNHKLTEPWEFYVVSGAAKEQLARLRAQLKLSKHPDPASEQAQKSYRRAYTELATVPWAILVTMKVDPDENRRQEDYAATSCAIQNLMLTATSHGLGAYWGTGPLLNHPDAHRLLGVPEGRKGVGMVFLGYPAEQPQPPRRTPWQEKTRWVE